LQDESRAGLEVKVLRASLSDALRMTVLGKCLSGKKNLEEQIGRRNWKKWGRKV
jgi:hypothetical protein